MAKPLTRQESGYKMDRDSGRWSLPKWKKEAYIREGLIDKSGCYVEFGGRCRRYGHRGGKFRWLKRMMTKCRRRWFQKEISEQLEEHE